MSAFYLKYRPQSLDDLAGQENVKKILLSAFENNKLSHAYLFAGPRGTGKTSTARILAKMINCEKIKGLASRSEESGDKVPCNECSMCVSITDGSNLDLIEIDAASNRGIEDIRSLREKIKLAPTRSRKKVYIIDEVHMLTAEAFNALLKTLEEPPSHVLFILATTDAGKLPQTILSRVQILDFRPATPKELLEALQKIVKGEGIDINEEGLKLLVKKSEGSFRDGVKFLDQVSSMGEKITVQMINDSLKYLSFEDLLQMMRDLSGKNTKECLMSVSTLVSSGADVRQLMLSLMDSFRSLVFIKNELGEQLVKSHFSEGEYQELIKLSENFTSGDLIKILNILQQNLEKLKYSIPSLPLELAVVEICGSENSIEKIHPQSSIIDHPSSNDSSDILKLKEKWTYVCETIRPYNFSLEAMLRSITVRECNETTIIMEVPYSFHQRILEAPKNRDLLEGVFSDILGRQIKVSTVLGNRPQRKEDIANIEVAADDEIIRAAAEIFNADSIN